MSVQTEAALFTIGVQQEFDLENAFELRLQEKIALGDEAWAQYEAGTMSEAELGAFIEFLLGPSATEEPLSAEETALAAELSIAADAVLS